METETRDQSTEASMKCIIIYQKSLSYLSTFHQLLIQTLYETEQFEKKYSLLTRTLGKNNQIILPSISCLKYPGPAHDGVN